MGGVRWGGVRGEGQIEGGFTFHDKGTGPVKLCVGLWVDCGADLPSSDGSNQVDLRVKAGRFACKSR